MSEFLHLDENELLQEIERVYKRAPLVHCMTNAVAMHLTADTLLAMGASPAMLLAKEEAPDFTRTSDALLINPGTATSLIMDSMLLTARAAGYAKKPWVLDPVAAGATLWRTLQLHKFLSLIPTAVRANASEITALLDAKTSGKGVDSLIESDAALDAAKTLARHLKTIVALTGKTDYVTDGEKTYAIEGGNALATKVSGIGCTLSAVHAAFLVESDNPLFASACACAVVKKAAYLAAQKETRLGHFKIAFVDAIDDIFHSQRCG